MKPPLRIGVVGGSIAGCTVAIELLRAGFSVTLFERSRMLSDRGAGIAMGPSLIDTLKLRDLVGSQMAYLPVRRRRYVARCAGADTHKGRILWETDSWVDSTNWDVLYRELRARVPDAAYRAGSQVVSIDVGNSAVTLTDGTQHHFDLLVCADGYDSLGRRTLFPDCQPQYAGYVAWRGLIAESAVADISLFDDVRLFSMYPGGHAVIYVVPGPNGELQEGRRRLNWVVYDKLAVDAHTEVLIDKQAVLRRGSLAPGMATPHQTRYIHDLARTYLPGFVADAIAATTSPFMQGIFDVTVPAYVLDNICLLGDAATVARPHTGAGSTKAILDAIALSQALLSHDSLDAALRAWSEDRCLGGNVLVTQGQTLGRGLVTDVPDWCAMSPMDMQLWDTALRRTVR